MNPFDNYIYMYYTTKRNLRGKNKTVTIKAFVIKKMRKPKYESLTEKISVQSKGRRIISALYKINIRSRKAFFS